MRGVGNAERLAQLGREALERSGEAHERSGRRGLALEHLGGEIRVHGAARLAQPVERDIALGFGDGRERLDREPRRDRPAGRRRVHELGGLGRLRSEHGRYDHPRFIRAEREVRGVELEDAARAAEAFDRKRDVVARRDDEMQHGGRVPAERFDEANRRGRLSDLVQVVEHEHEVAAQALVEGCAQRGGVRLRTSVVVRVGDGPAPAAHGGLDLGRKPRHADAEGVENAARERAQHDVLGRQRVPARAHAERPAGEKRGLPEARCGDDCGQASAERFVESALEMRPRHERLRQPCRRS